MIRSLQSVYLFLRVLSVNQLNDDIRILLIDDHPVVMHGLTALLNSEPGVNVCAQTGHLSEALQLIEKHDVSLAVVDMLLEGTTGIQVTDAIKTRYPKVAVIIFSMSDEPQYVKGAFEKGAAGYLTKDEVAEQIIVAIREVHNGGIFISKKLAQKYHKAEIRQWLSAKGRFPEKQ